MKPPRIVYFVFLACLLPAKVWAQAETGNIVGVVRDTSGAVMPGVTVEAASPALIEKVQVHADAETLPFGFVFYAADDVNKIAVFRFLQGDAGDNKIVGRDARGGDRGRSGLGRVVRGFGGQRARLCRSVLERQLLDHPQPDDTGDHPEEQDAQADHRPGQVPGGWRR